MRKGNGLSEKVNALLYFNKGRGCSSSLATPTIIIKKQKIRKVIGKMSTTLTGEARNKLLQALTEKYHITAEAAEELFKAWQKGDKPSNGLTKRIFADIERYCNQ